MCLSPEIHQLLQTAHSRSTIKQIMLQCDCKTNVALVVHQANSSPQSIRQNWCKLLWKQPFWGLPRKTMTCVLIELCGTTSHTSWFHQPRISRAVLLGGTGVNPTIWDLAYILLYELRKKKQLDCLSFDKPPHVAYSYTITAPTIIRLPWIQNTITISQPVCFQFKYRNWTIIQQAFLMAHNPLQDTKHSSNVKQCPISLTLLKPVI